MKIRYVDFYKVVLYILVFFNLGFSDFLKEYIMQIQLVTIIVAVILLCIYLIQPKKSHIDDKLIFVYISMLFLLVFIEIIRINNNVYSSISTVGAINLIRNYAFVLLFFPIYEILNSDIETKNGFIKVIVTLGFCALLFRFVGWFAYNYLGYNLVPGYFGVMGYNWTRNGNVRLGGTFLDGLMFTYFCLKLLNNRKLKNKVIYTCCVSFMILYSYFVYGSRSQLLCYICVFIILCVVSGKNVSTGVLNLVLILGGLVIILYTTSTIQNFLASFSINDKMYGAGTQIRVAGQKLYQQMWIENSKLLGFGITEDGNYIGLTKYYLSDLGILRNLYQYGIVGFIICIIPFIDGVITAVSGVVKNTKDSGFLLGLVMYTIMTSIASQNVYDYSRIMILPFLLGFIGLVSRENKLRGEYHNG